MLYYTDDLALPLPEGEPHTDNTLNILVLPQRSANLTVSRGLLKEDEKLESLIEQQLDRLRQRAVDLKTEPTTAIQVGAGNISGYQARCQLTLGTVAAHQIIAVFVVPDTRRVIVMTLSKQGAFSEADDAYWNALKAGIQMRKR